MLDGSVSIPLFVLVVLVFLSGAAIGAFIHYIVTRPAREKERVKPSVPVKPSEPENPVEPSLTASTQKRSEAAGPVKSGEQPNMKPARKDSTSATHRKEYRKPQPEKSQVGAVFHLSDLKTQIPCGPLDQCADPRVADNYERSKKFFEEVTWDDTWLNPAMQTVPAFGDHMRSPLLKPTGSVACDEQTALSEIMRFLQGNRQYMVRMGNKMAPLDFQHSVQIYKGRLEYTYDSYQAWDSGCYDSGTFEPGEYYTAHRTITVYLATEREYRETCERACTDAHVVAAAKKALSYDGSLTFEDDTEAFIQCARNEYTLYLHKPFGMKDCLRILMRFAV